MSALADVLLVVHFGFVLFVVLGLPLVWWGAAAGWGWIRHRAFRLAHLAAILFVAVEALLGMMCPLTVWEDALRGGGPASGFIARRVHDWLYYDLPPAAFTAAYVGYALLAALTYWKIPPRRGGRRGGTS